jgi:hypothetical protein
MKPEVISPPNELLRIEKLWIYVSRDAAGNEGVCAAQFPNGMLAPLIAADQARLASLTPIAEQLAALTDKEIVLVEFSTRTELRKIEGPSS